MMTRQVVSKTKSKYIYSAAAAKKRAKLSNKSIQTKSIIQFNTKFRFIFSYSFKHTVNQADCYPH